MGLAGDRDPDLHWFFGGNHVVAALALAPVTATTRTRVVLERVMRCSVRSEARAAHPVTAV